VQASLADIKQLETSQRFDKDLNRSIQKYFESKRIYQCLLIKKIVSIISDSN
jgi:hypothetical protein